MKSSSKIVMFFSLFIFIGKFDKFLAIYCACSIDKFERAFYIRSTDNTEEGADHGGFGQLCRRIRKDME